MKPKLYLEVKNLSDKWEKLGRMPNEYSQIGKLITS